MHDLYNQVVGGGLWFVLFPIYTKFKIESDCL